MSPKRQCAISVGSQITNNHQQIKFANSGIVAATAVALSNKISTHTPHPSAIQINPVTATTAVAVAHPTHHFAPHNIHFVQRQPHQINATAAAAAAAAASNQHYQQYTTQSFITATTVNPSSISSSVIGGGGNIQIPNEEANITNISSTVKLNSNTGSNCITNINNSSGTLTTLNSNTTPENTTQLSVVNTKDTKMDNQMALAPLGLSQSMDSVNTASNEEEVSCAILLYIYNSLSNFIHLKKFL